MLNSKIQSVINDIKNWFRFNFTIEIFWNEDIDRTIAIINKVAKAMPASLYEKKNFTNLRKFQLIYFFPA
jgi:hypothetical protein